MKTNRMKPGFSSTVKVRPSKHDVVHCWHPILVPGYLLVLWVLQLLAAAGAFAAVRYVNATSANATPPYTNWATAAWMIQDAVDAAAPGDEIVVTNGLYATGGRAVGTNLLLNRVAVDKPVTLRSVNGPQFTVIAGAKAPGGGNGDGAVRCVYLTNGASLSGFTLTNGATRTSGDEQQEQWGGGVWSAWWNYTTASLSNCVLVGNSAAACGGGVKGGTLYGCTVTGNRAGWEGGGTVGTRLYNCTLSGNVADFDGGAVEGGTLYNCSLTRNSAGRDGGGALLATLYNCTLTGNAAQVGGGVSSGQLYNCTLTGNSATRTGGGVTAFYEYGYCFCELYNCIVYGNQAPKEANYAMSYASDYIKFEYSCTTPLPPGPGNIAIDPQLASPTHLAPSSPCIGAGSPAYAQGVDIDGQQWVSPPAMGADQPGAGIGPLRVSIESVFTNVATDFAVLFAATIEGPVWQTVWDFGDGTILTNQPVASHAWRAPGLYTVRLTGYSESYSTGVTADALITVSTEVYHVNAANTTPVFPYASWETAAQTIQDAIGAGTLPGRVVLVTNGVYATGAANLNGLNRVALTNRVVVRSVNGPGMTLIEGNTGAVRCAYVGGSSVLSGFTLRKGVAAGEFPDSCGGGAWCHPGGVVTNCLLLDNSASGQGGGAHDGILYNCVLENNTAYYGGAADLSTLYQCIVRNNTAVAGGGGCVYATLMSCTVANNSGGTMLSSCDAKNCIIYFNPAPNEANCDSFSKLEYCCTTPLPTNGVGNITNAPLFVDYAGGNLRLQSGSPCINAGWNAYAPGPTDLDGQPRIANGTVDIGSYEFPAPAPGSWTRMKDMPMALDAHASCAVNGILYVIGGHEIPRVYHQLATLFAYDPKANSWTRKTDMPTARRWPAACVVDGIIYVMGGGSMFSAATNAMEAYDPRTDTWVSKAKLPGNRGGVAVCAVDGIIYAIGGAVGTLSAGDLQSVSTVEAYDPKTDRWTRKASLPITAAWPAVGAVNGQIYLFFRYVTLAYDPNADRWTRKTSIPSSSINSIMSAFSTVNGIIYLFGGEISPPKGGYTLSLAYDPARDKFTPLRNLPMKCEAAAAATIDGRIYHTGGTSGDPDNYPGAVYYAQLWVFDPYAGVFPCFLSVASESPSMVRLVWRGEAGLRYGVQSRTNVAGGPWTRWMFSSGTNAVVATNAVLEATVTIPAADTQRFFRVLEAD